MSEPVFVLVLTEDELRLLHMASVNAENFYSALSAFMPGGKVEERRRARWQRVFFSVSAKIRAARSRCQHSWRVTGKRHAEHGEHGAQEFHQEVPQVWPGH